MQIFQGEVNLFCPIPDLQNAKPVFKDKSNPYQRISGGKEFNDTLEP